MFQCDLPHGIEDGSIGAAIIGIIWALVHFFFSKRNTSRTAR